VRVAEFAAPSENERRHHFLWRFWPVLPGWGGMAVLDRSWYGRVLIERVEGFATKSEWRRAYEEIVAFEHGLCGEGMVLVRPGERSGGSRAIPHSSTGHPPRRRRLLSGAVASLTD
jgi:polyphosphate kinase 2 (PPK2 family)